MARTPDRYLQNSSDKRIIKRKKYCVGNYIRLSIDSDYTDSDSIQNQRSLAREYLQNEKEIEAVFEYVDDGRTGTNFMRPSYERMMADIRSGKINCILVKDLSRFGREYLEAGNYIEKVFPFLGVRFISINDSYDSEDPYCSKELLKISLKNLIHEMYAKDISKKISSTYKIKQERGMFYRTATIPYGYKMNEANSNYCVDEKVSHIIKEIYRKYESGVSKYRIGRMLQEQQIATPMQYQKNGKVYCDTPEEVKVWHSSVIEKILTNSVYVGVVVRHKSEQRLWAGEGSHMLPETEWIKIIDNHEPLISHEQFGHVQELLNITKKEYKRYRENSNISGEQHFDKNVFSGKLLCGDCRESMVRTVTYRSVNGEKKRMKRFQCTTYRNMSHLCDTKFIDEEKLCQMVHGAICRQLKLLKEVKQVIENDIKYSFKSSFDTIQKEKSRLESSRFALEQEYIKQHMAIHLQNNKKDMFYIFRNKYVKETSQIQTHLDYLYKEEKKLKKCQRAYKKLLECWLAYDGYKYLIEEMIEIFVERIELYSDKRLTITLKYQDSFELVYDYMQLGGVDQWVCS